MPLVIPALNRDGDCLSDLVMPMFGSIAGAESVLLAFDDDLSTQVAMAEAPHGTAPALEGKDLANPMAMILACAAVLQYAAVDHPELERPSRAIYEAVMETTAAGIRTPDLGGHASTSGFTSEVITRVQTKLDVWASLGLYVAGWSLSPSRCRCAASGSSIGAVPAGARRGPVRHGVVGRVARSPTRSSARTAVAETSRLTMFSASCRPEPRTEDQSP